MQLCCIVNPEPYISQFCIIITKYWNNWLIAWTHNFRVSALWLVRPIDLILWHMHGRANHSLNELGDKKRTADYMIPFKDWPSHQHRDSPGGSSQRFHHSHKEPPWGPSLQHTRLWWDIQDPRCCHLRIQIIYWRLSCVLLIFWVSPNLTVRMASEQKGLSCAGSICEPACYPADVLCYQLFSPGSLC